MEKPWITFHFLTWRTQDLNPFPSVLEFFLKVPLEIATSLTWHHKMLKKSFLGNKPVNKMLKSHSNLLEWCSKILLVSLLWSTLPLWETLWSDLVKMETKLIHWCQLILSLITLFKLMSVEFQEPILKMKKSNSTETMKDSNSLNGDKMHLKTFKLFLPDQELYIKSILNTLLELSFKTNIIHYIQILWSELIVILLWLMG